MMLVDCQTCPVRDVHCADCMVTALTTIPVREAAVPVQAHAEAPGVPLDRAERRAVSVLIAAGLVSHETANAVRATIEETPASVIGFGRAAV